jgi:hypothetical protein
MMHINIWAVIVSAIASMVIGSIWYGVLFGKAYGTAMGWTNRTSEESKQMMKGMQINYVWQFIASIITFFVLDLFVTRYYDFGTMAAIKVALVAWIGFVVPMEFGKTLWGGKKVLFWLTVGNSLLVRGDNSAPRN